MQLMRRLYNKPKLGLQLSSTGVNNGLSILYML